MVSVLWEEYYDKLGYWGTSTLVSRMSKLESYGSPDEVAEVVTSIAFHDEKGAGRLLKRATAAGVKFTGAQLAGLVGCCSEEVLDHAIECSADRFTTVDLDDLYGCCGDDLLVGIALKHKIRLPECLSDYEIAEYGYQTIDDLTADLDVILGCLSTARKHLQEALTYSAWDIAGTSRSLSVLKHAHVEDAGRSISHARSIWELLEFPGKDEGLFCDSMPGIGRSDMWLDYFFDGFWMDLIANRRIRKMLKNLDRVISAVRAQRDSIR